MTQAREASNGSEMLFLMSPNALAFPALDKGRRATSKTVEIIRKEWPAIADVVQEGRVSEGIAAMEQLAQQLRSRTNKDPEPWLETLTMSRRLLYENMMAAARWGRCVSMARAALQRCRKWDDALRSYIDWLLQESKEA